MSLRQELEIWSDALAAYDKQDYPTSLSLFQTMEPGSKIHFNIGIVYATRGQHEQAIEAFERAIELDSYLAIAYFQAGVSRFLLQRYEEARKDFDDASVYLRSNEIIDYEQIGLKFQLYSCEILFNRGLCQVYLGRVEEGLKDWSTAIKEKYTQEHDVIDEAFLDKGQGYTVFSVSVGTVFRPSESKIANLAPRDFLGKPTVVAAINPFDLHLDFQCALPAVTVEPLPSNPPKSSLSRSRTTAARLENSVDGVAQPLRRRPTLEERKASEGERALKRSQTAPPAIVSISSNGLNQRPRPSDLARLHLPSDHDPRPPSPPDSQTELEVIDPGLEANRRLAQVPPSKTNMMIGRSSSDPYPPPASTHRRAASFSEKRNRRNGFTGLTIQVPPVPSSSLRQNTDRLEVHDLQSRPVTYRSPSPAGTASLSSRFLRTAHLRSASLPSPNAHSVGTLESPNQRYRYPKLYAASRAASPLVSTFTTEPASSFRSPSVCIPRQYRNSLGFDSASPPSMSNPSCLSPIVAVNRSVPSSTPGSALLAYLQEAERSTTLVPTDAPNTRVDEEEEHVRSLRIRLRIVDQDQIRAMTVPSNIELESLVGRIRVKLGDLSKLSLRYRDSDECLISIVDQEDWQCALDSIDSPSSDRPKLDIIVCQG